MTFKEIVHWIIGSVIDLLVIVFLVKTAWDGNDKAIILVILCYSVLVIINLLFWLFFKFMGKREAAVYKTLMLCLLLLFLPVLFIAGLY